MAIPFYDINEGEERFEIDKLTVKNPDMIKLFAKHLAIYQDLARFWQPRIAVAKKCHNYIRRDIFTKEQRIKYLEVQDKWPIEPQVIKPVINTLVGQITDRVKSGTVTVEDETPPENAAHPEVARVALKWLENTTGLNDKRQKALREGLIDGYPQWVVVDKIESPIGGESHYKVTKEPWETMLCSKWFEEDDGADIHEYMRVRRYTTSEMMRMYPQRKQAYQEFDQARKDNPEWLRSFTERQMEYDAGSRNALFYDMIMSMTANDYDDMHTVIEHTFSVTKERKIYIKVNPNAGLAGEDDYYGDPVTLPEDWSEQQVDMWLQNNPEYTYIHTDKVATLWVTTFQTNGFIWENGAHWYQYQDPHSIYADLPGRCYIASMEDHIPTGAGEDMAPYVLSIAACATEGLSQVRKGTSRTTFIEEGAVKNPKYLASELSREEGVVIMKKDKMERFKQEQRKPNDAYFGLEERYREQLKEVHNVTPAMMGAFAPRQSSVAKDKEIMQGLMPQSSYVTNYMRFVLNTTQMLCNMFPFIMSEYKLIEIDDEFGKKQSAEMNIPMHDYEGNAIGLINDMCASRYRIVPTLGDDSKTSREQDLRNFVDMISAIGNSLFNLMEVNPRMVAGFLGSWDNRFAKEAARYIIENAEQMDQQQQQAMQAEQQLEKEQADRKYEVDKLKATMPNVNYKLGAEDVQNAPMGWMLMMQYAGQQEGKINKQAHPEKQMEQIQQLQQQMGGGQPPAEPGMEPAPSQAPLEQLPAQPMEE